MSGRTITFHVDTKASTWSVKYAPLGDPSNVTWLNFDGTNTARSQMESRRYMLSWVFAGTAGTKFLMTVVDADGTELGVYPDQVPDGASLGHHVGLLVVP